MGFAKVTMIGNMTRDPEVKFLPSQTQVTEFGMAANRKYKTQEGEDREDVVFVDCSAFGRLAEIIAEYCKKGKQLYIEGRLKLDQWEDGETGKPRSKLRVVVEQMTMLGGRDDREDGGGNGANRGGGDERPRGNWQDRPPSSPQGQRGREQYGNGQGQQRQQRQPARQPAAAPPQRQQRAPARQPQQTPAAAAPPQEERQYDGGFNPDADLPLEFKEGDIPF